MNIQRRQLLAGSAALAAGGMLPTMPGAFAADDVKLGSVLDTSGIFDAYGKPMDMAMRLAVDEINAAGGLLGRKIGITAYDTQSDMALYTQYGQQLARRDKVDVVHGGILSASREAIRQTLRKSKVLYFYNVLYEGGVCDRNIFITGVTPAQQVEIVVPAAIKKWGPKIYILAADYNYGQITARWVQNMRLKMAAKQSRQISSRWTWPISVQPSQKSRPRHLISSCLHLSVARICRSTGNGPRQV